MRKLFTAVGFSSMVNRSVAGVEPPLSTNSRMAPPVAKVAARWAVVPVVDGRNVPRSVVM